MKAGFQRGALASGKAAKHFSNLSTDVFWTVQHLPFFARSTNKILQDRAVVV